MYRIQLIFLFLLCFVAANGQETVDVLFLQNGSIIKGKIIENNEAVVKIETCCGSIFVYQKAEIIKIEQEKDSYPSEKTKERGYFNYSSMGMLLGSTANEKQAQLSILSEHNYKINNNFAIGVTTGFELLRETTVPLAANMKVICPLNKQDLYIGITGGYNFSVENPEPGYISSYTGGVLFNIEFGSIVPLSQNSAFFIALGYRYNELHYKLVQWYWDWQDEVDRTYQFNRISIRLGIVMY
jgi:hypothetical protein